MKRILPDYAYGPAPNAGCVWNEFIEASGNSAPLSDPISAKYVVIGAGVTGLNAGLELAQNGEDVVIIDAEHPGWGASARNGGFCCLGGTALSLSGIRKIAGADGQKEWCQAEIASVDYVKHRLDTLAIDADVHSKGETILAHSPRAFRTLQKMQTEAEEAYGFETVLHTRSELPDLGMTDQFQGALTLPNGFGLNPGKYVEGLVQACIEFGVRIFANTPALKIESQSGGYRVQTKSGSIQAEKIIFATNGYGSEDVPDWMAGRFMPLQSNILVTRPLTKEELQAGWHSDQMAYTHQTLLHYFRLLPDKRFLFGMRGGLRATSEADTKMRQRIRSQFEKAFPMWADVETPHSWNGVLAFSANLTPVVGPIPEMPGAYTAFGFHGNGVAMGSYAGALIADLARNGTENRLYPKLMQKKAGRFPLGRHRRALMMPAYTLATLIGG